MLDRILDVSYQHNTANQMVKSIGQDEAAPNSLRDILGHLEDEEIYQMIMRDFTSFLVRFYQDDIFQNGSFLRKTLFSNAANMSTSLALSVYDKLFPFLDQVNFRASSLYQSAAAFLSPGFNFLKGGSKIFEKYLIDPFVPLVKLIRTFPTVALQEFFSFAILTPALTGFLAHLASSPEAQDELLWFQLALIALTSLVLAPLVTNGIRDGFSHDEDWDEYFVKRNGKLVEDASGRLIPDLAKWDSRAKIVAHAFLMGGLIRSAKVAKAMFAKIGHSVAFSVELATDILLYVIYFGIDALNNQQTGLETDWALALTVTTISVIAYCYTAPEIGGKYHKYKAILIRQDFSVLKNPAVMVAGSGILSGSVSIAFITAFSLGLWAWAKYGFEGEPELIKYTGSGSSDDSMPLESLPATA